jgi:hypothetical protein
MLNGSYQQVGILEGEDDLGRAGDEIWSCQETGQK